MSNQEPKPMPVFAIRAKLPHYFTMFSHESLQEMIFDKNMGYTTPLLSEEAAKEYEASPRAFMIRLLKKERDGAIECLRLLGAATE